MLFSVLWIKTDWLDVDAQQNAAFKTEMFDKIAFKFKRIQAYSMVFVLSVLYLLSVFIKFSNLIKFVFEWGKKKRKKANSNDFSVK